MWRVMNMLAGVALAGAVTVAAPSTTQTSQPSTTQAAGGPAATAPQADAATSAGRSAPEDGQWTMPGKNYALWRYSGLDQINTENAGQLKVAWEFSTGVNRGHEAAPLVVGTTMYVVTPFPNLLYALDLEKAAKGENPLKWKYDPKPLAAAQGVACCDLVNRGCFFDDGKIYFNTLDVHTVCVDAATGQEVWKTKLGDINTGESITMAPLVARGKVYVGNSGGEFGVRGWIKALDAKDGHVVWTAYNSGPDKDVLIGGQFKPFYDWMKGTDLGVKTWPGDHWKLGGGTVWGWVSYDPETNLIFYGSGNPGCWNPDLRPGDNLWSTSIFARDADTGQARWAYQASPHDLFDHDEVNESVVLDLTIDGQPRKTIVHPGRTGYMYVMDRTNGEVLSATPYVRITAAKGVDLKTGRLIPNDEKTPQTGKVVRDIQPASPGAKDWQPSAWSPRTQLLYVPHQNLACDYEAVETGYIAGTPYVGVNEKMYAGADDPGYLGYFTAWDPVAKKAVWRIKEKFPCWSGACVTAGDVVFYGTMDGYFKVVDARPDRNGKELFKFHVASGIISQPTTFKGPDGKQYVAVLSGVGGWAGAVVAGDLDVRDPTGALGFVNAMKELPKYTTKGGTLYVFALP
jgi:PQQ-dependent dehydrogenase (methanol/ethanol family)